MSDLVVIPREGTRGPRAVLRRPKVEAGAILEDSTGHPAAQVFPLPHGEGNLLAVHQRDGIRVVVALANLVQVHQLTVVDADKLGVVDQALHVPGSSRP